MSLLDKKIDDELKKLDQTTSPQFQWREDDSASIFLIDGNSGDSISASLWDDITIQPLDLANLAPLLNTVSLGGSGAYTGGSGAYTGTLGASGAYSSYNWNHTVSNPVNITNTGIIMDDDCDITIGGRSMKAMLENIEKRLNILVPDPKKLERYEALRQAYEHYLTLEALCLNDDPPKT